MRVTGTTSNSDACAGTGAEADSASIVRRSSICPVVPTARSLSPGKMTMSPEGMVMLRVPRSILMMFAPVSARNGISLSGRPMKTLSGETSSSSRCTS